MNTDWIGQINARQARAIIVRMALAGTVTALGVLSQHLDSIIATTSPLGMALAFGIAQTLIYLNSGQTPPAPKG
jgi:DNA helicase TIP49 (TBP-interacting protein)